MRILITEDDAIARRVLELFLQPHGVVDVAARGDEAVECFNRAFKEGEPYSLVCLDIGLPGKPGLEVLREIRAYEKRLGILDPVAVIMLTGVSEEKQIAEARTLGATKYLLKPVIEAELIAHLEQLGLIKQ